MAATPNLIGIVDIAIEIAPMTTGRDDAGTFEFSCVHSCDDQPFP